MDHLVAWRRFAVAVVWGLIAAGLSFVLTLRAENPGAEPAGQNWWLVCWFVMAAAYGTAGAALLFWPARRRLAIWFLLIAATALLTAVSVQYDGFVTANGGRPPLPRLAELDDWTRPVMAGVLAALVPWELLPKAWRDHRVARVLQLLVAVALAVVVVVEALDGPREVTRVATWAVCIVATVATAASLVHWWRDQRSSGDPLPAWLAAGTAVAWLAVVPDATDLASWRLPGRDVVTAMLFVATVPLLVAGVLLELVRRSTSGRGEPRIAPSSGSPLRRASSSSTQRSSPASASSSAGAVRRGSWWPRRALLRWPSNQPGGGSTASPTGSSTARETTPSHSCSASSTMWAPAVTISWPHSPTT